MIELRWVWELRPYYDPYDGDVKMTQRILQYRFGAGSWRDVPEELGGPEMKEPD